MSIFSQYVKQAAAARATAGITSEADPLTPLVVEEAEIAVESLVAQEPTDVAEQVEEAPVDIFAQARERLNQTHHNLIRGRSQIVTGAADPVVLFDETVPTQEVDAVTAEAPEQVEQTDQAEQVEQEVVEQEAEVTQVEDDVVEAPVDIVPEGDEIEEPALDVTAEEEPVVVDEPAVVEEPIVVDEPVVDDEVVTNDVVSEVEEPIDHDIDDNDAEVEFESSAEDAVMLEERDLDQLETEMNMLAQSMYAVETYGINPTAVHIMQTTGLLNGTALESLGLEAFGFEGPDHPESQMALEALGDKMKEKAAQWSAKVVSLASSFGTKVMGVLEPIWEKITGSIKTLGSAAWDQAKAAGKVVKAHPYKTLIGVILAVAATAGVVLWAGGSLPAITAKGPQVTKFVTDLAGKINKIKWPFGNVTATVAEGGTKIKTVVTTAGTAAKGVALDTLGWTGSMVNAAGSQLGRAWTVTKQGVGAFGDRAAKIGTSIASGYKATGETIGMAGKSVASTVTRKTGNELLGIGAGLATIQVLAGFVVNVVINLIKLVYQIIAGGLRIIASTLNALVGGTRVATA